MSVKKVFTVYDSKAEVYGQPFLCNTQGEAIRSFMDAAQDEKSQIAQHPEDFSLFMLGSYDEYDASYKMLDAKVSLGLALDLVRKE